MNFKLNRNITCDDCNGQGFVTLIGGDKPNKECPKCQGYGCIDVENDLPYWEKLKRKDKLSLTYAKLNVKNLTKSISICEENIKRINSHE